MGLTLRQQRALLAITETPNLTAAAAVAGVGQSTLRRWFAKDQEFQDAYRDIRREMARHTLSTLSPLKVLTLS
jgi:hypothetical protein